MRRKTKNIEHELCDYNEAYDRESASDIGWCGKCKIPECPYNKGRNINGGNIIENNIFTT